MHKNIQLLKWFNFFTDFRLYAPFAIIYFVQVSGSYALGMSIFSIVFISSAIFEIPTGIFSDYIGRKKTMILGALFAVIFSIFYAIGGLYIFLAVGALFEGLSKSFYSGTNDAFLYDTLAENKDESMFDKFLGETVSYFQFALAISSILGGFLAEWSFSLIMWISVVSQIVCLILAIQFIEPKTRKKEGDNIYSHLKIAAQKFVENYNLRLLSIGSIIGFAFGEAAFQFQAAFYKSLWPLWAIGVAKTLSNVGAGFSFKFSDKVIKKFGAFRSLFIGNVYSRVINLIALIFPSVFSPLIMSSTSLIYGVITVSKTSLMQKEFTPEQRATMGSLNSFAGSLLFGVVAFVLGFMADKLSPAQALIISQIFLLPNIILYWILFRKNG